MLYFILQFLSFLCGLSSAVCPYVFTLCFHIFCLSILCTLCPYFHSVFPWTLWSGYILSSDERYIVLIGGYTTGKKLVKKIYVLDVEAMKFIKSSTISSPASGTILLAL